MNKKIILGVVVIVAIALAAVFILPSSKNLFQGFIGRSPTLTRTPSSSDLPRSPDVAESSTEQSSAPEGGQSGSAPEGQSGAAPEGGQPGPAPEGQSGAAPEGQSGSTPEGQPGAAPEGQPGAAPEGQPGAAPEGQPDTAPEATLPDLAAISISTQDKDKYMKFQFDFDNKNAKNIQMPLTISLKKISSSPSLELLNKSLSFMGSTGSLENDYLKKAYNIETCSIYELSVTLDADNAITESNEGNNKLEYTFYTNLETTIAATPVPYEILQACGIEEKEEEGTMGDNMGMGMGMPGPGF